MNANFIFTRFAACLLLVSVLFSCEDDDVVVSTSEGRFSLELTDAPVDDPNVSAVFVTVADVKLDGASVSGFSRTTVELSALQNGVTEMIANADVEAKAYNSVEIVLDDANDATNSGGPGCYVLTADNAKVALEVVGDGSLEAANSGFTITQGGNLATVIDFDLRKALVRTDDAARPYAFAAENRLESSLRFVERESTGTLSGSVTNNSGEDTEVVIYAYAANTYTAAEREGDSDDELFLNAVASTRLSASGDYEFNFLPAGNYELVAVAYEDEDGDGETALKGSFVLNAFGSLSLSGVQVSAQASTTINLTLLSLLP
ncbi:DUF4382 domain-containing protein [Neolewinella agarilytica]|uniref:DUF4382 domain-containing protein n=1 Tax=Neolewinella agarilytica TaxID=478744 RepID=A0A1H9LRQ3_9BACT|nr:DUF4382 domain-containing protein [Neolewinella agarilytica]SER13949.1 protein of unknown function [Neolewinella agarilytica]